MRQVVLLEAGKGRSPRTNIEQKFGNRLDLFKSGTFEIVAPAEGDDAPFGDEALEEKLGQWKRGNALDQHALFGRRNDVVRVPKAFRLLRSGEQVRLCCFLRHRME